MRSLRSFAAKKFSPKLPRTLPHHPNTKQKICYRVRRHRVAETVFADDEPLKSEDDEAMNQPADTANSRQAHRFASTLTERIQDNSSAIIKGAFVSHRSFEDGQVIVEITASRESIGAARQLSGMMRGAMQ